MLGHLYNLIESNPYLIVSDSHLNAHNFLFLQIWLYQKLYLWLFFYFLFLKIDDWWLMIKIEIEFIITICDGVIVYLSLSQEIGHTLPTPNWPIAKKMWIYLPLTFLIMIKELKLLTSKVEASEFKSSHCKSQFFFIF